MQIRLNGGANNGAEVVRADRSGVRGDTRTAEADLALTWQLGSVFGAFTR